MKQATVLVVEDDPANLELVVALLEGKGYTVYQAAHGTSVIELVKVRRPDLIILDLQLPGVDGLTLARQLKGDPETQGIPLLAMTAYALPADRERALEAGCDGYISKPLDTRQLVELVRGLLELKAQGPKPMARPRILVVDDEAQHVDLLESFLHPEGYEVMTALDGEEGLGKVPAWRPDLILLDVKMPKLDGLQLCRRLKDAPSTRLIPIVMITALGELEDRVQGIEAGCDDFLTKPVDKPELLARIHSLLRMKALTDELESAEAVLCTLGRSVEARDPYTQGHCERLAEYAVALGREQGMQEQDLTALRRGGYLHDLGKVAVPDAILLKNGSLTPEERAVMQRHPVVGEEICRPLRSLQAVLPIIRHHHERWDGSGYPDGLRGEAIPLTARVLQVVDVFDALTTDRPYRPALPRAAALGALEAGARQGWSDPRIVRGFRSVVHAMGAT